MGLINNTKYQGYTHDVLNLQYRIINRLNPVDKITNQDIINTYRDFINSGIIKINPHDKEYMLNECDLMEKYIGGLGELNTVVMDLSTPQ
jgi:hypothetical protein